MSDHWEKAEKIENIIKGDIKILPKVIMFYGPPGSGKGTQSHLLHSRLDLPVLDWGHELRKFSASHLDEKNTQNGFVANRIQEYFLENLPVLSEDLEYVVGQSIRDGILKNEKTLVMDKCGSKINEANWLSGLLDQHKIKSILFHLPLQLEVSVDRVSNRFYVPGDSTPYMSYEAALAVCPAGVFPQKRIKDDRDSAIARYDALYRDQCEEIIEIYKRSRCTNLVEIEASLPVAEVYTTVLDSLIHFVSKT